MIVVFGSLLEDVIKHLVHFGAVEIHHGNLWRRNQQAQTLLGYSWHGATPGQSDRTLRRRHVARREPSVLRVSHLRGAVVRRRIVEVPANLVLHSLHVDRGRGRLVLLLHLEGRRRLWFRRRFREVRCASIKRLWWIVDLRRTQRGMMPFGKCQLMPRFGLGQDDGSRRFIGAGHQVLVTRVHHVVRNRWAFLPLHLRFR